MTRDNRSLYTFLYGAGASAGGDGEDDEDGGGSDDDGDDDDDDEEEEDSWVDCKRSLKRPASPTSFCRPRKMPSRNCVKFWTR